MKTQILSSKTSGILVAARSLHRGQLVAMPTETVYGLAGNVFNPLALAEIFKAKGRPKNDPLIVHLAWPKQKPRSILAWLQSQGLIRLHAMSPEAAETAERLARAFWPGPLTLVLPKSPRVPALATAGLPNVAIRVPAHPVAQALLAASSLPLAAPSANRFGRISPTSAMDVMAELSGRIPWILDGGPSRVGLESTVVRIDPRGRPIVLRPGGITAEDLKRATRKQIAQVGPKVKTNLSPGLLKSHYAPRKSLWILPSTVSRLKKKPRLPKGTRSFSLLVQKGSASRAARRLETLSGVRISMARSLSATGSAKGAARALFSTLRALDRSAAGAILAEPVPSHKGLWAAVADRLRRASRGTLKGLAIAAIVTTAAQTARADVELHAHLFMDQGMGWMFDGDFFGPLRATSWGDRFRSQVNPDALNRSGARIVVASLYANPCCTLNLRASIRRQIADAKRFVAGNPSWIIAHSASEAKAALSEGKRALVLSLEGASGVLTTEADLEEFVDHEGVRIVTFLHLTDDELGGVAFLKGLRAWSSPVAYARHLWGRLSGGALFDKTQAPLNDRGLTPAGRALLSRLLARGVWIDLAHSSDAAQSEMLPVLGAFGQPPLYTHTSLRKYLGAERGISDAQIAQVRAGGGIIGVMPSVQMLPAPGSAVETCESAWSELTRHYQELAQAVGADSVMLGSDTNGGIPHLPPGCNPGLPIDATGYRDFSQFTGVWEALARRGAPVPKPLSRLSERFLQTWQRVTVPTHASLEDKYR